MQEDLEGFLLGYNRERLHQGHGINGGPSHQAFLDSIVGQEEEAGQETEEAA